MRAVIFANGQRPEPTLTRALLRPDDLLVAADGGARNILACGLRPHLLVGDFDSLTPTELGAFRAAGAEIIEYPARKDFTDLDLAMQLVTERGFTETMIVSGLGARWDQTLANLLLPAAFPGMKVRLVDGLQELIFVHGGETLEINGQPGDTVSLIPVCSDVEEISTSGLEYPLHGETLRFGATRGVSNVLVNQSAKVTLGRGLLICVVIHRKDNLE